jgi:hypothetical protein
MKTTATIAPICLLAFAACAQDLPVPPMSNGTNATPLRLVVRAALVDKDLNVKPIPGLALKIYRTAGQGTVTEVRTALDGTVSVELPSGAYRIESDRPLPYQGKAYTWRVNVVVSHNDQSYELTNDNATVVIAPEIAGSPDTNSVPEPEFADVFYRLEAGALVPLERQTLRYKGEVSGLIVVNVRSVSEIPGGKSSVRFKVGQLDFIVRTALAPSAFNPNSVYCLRKMNATKRRRELVTMVGYASPVGGENTLNLAGGALPVNFSNYGSSSLKMTTEELPAGEYTLGRTYGPAVFYFGVDSDELHTEKEGTMRSIPPRVIGAITAIATFGADTSLGTWKYNAAKSRSTSTNPIESRTDLREATADGSVKLTSTEQRADGTSSILSFTCKYDGREYPITGGAYDTISVKRVYSDTTSFKVKKSGGTYHLTGRNFVSKAGKTLTQTSKGTDAEGKPVTEKLVFDKQ